MQSIRPLALAAIALIILVWGSTWAVIRVGLVGVPPLAGISLRFLLAGTVLWLIGLVNRVPFGKGHNEKRLWLATATFTFIICYIVVYWGEQYVTSGLASVLWATYPLFVAVIARVVIPSEVIPRATVAGMVVSLAGLALIYSEDVRLLGGPKVLFAAVIFLLSPLSSAVGSVCVKRWGQGSNPLATTAIPMIITGVVVGALALVLERDRRLVFDATSVGAIVYLALVGTALAFGVYFWLLNHFPATRLAITANVTPLVALVIGATIMDEPMSPRVLLGSAIVLAGVALAVLPRALRKASAGS